MHVPVASTVASQLPQAFDPRLNNLVLTFVVTGLGGAASVHDAALEVVNGEGQVWLEPANLPALGEITEGHLIVASENFPAYAPLTMSLRGLELRFLAQGGNLLAGGLYAGGRSVLRLQCSASLSPSLVYALEWPGERRLIVRRWSLVDPGAPQELELEVLAGQVQSDRPRAASLGPGSRVGYNRICLAPEAGELRLRLVAARFVVEFRGGHMRLIRVFSSRGQVAAFAVRDARRFGTSVSVGFRDTLA